MPFHMYSYKQGSRSTPKLRRNKSNYDLKHGNCSVDSFSSLRPGSPDMMGQTMPNSPISIGSPPEFGFAAALSPTESPEQRLALRKSLPALDPPGPRSHAAKKRSHQALPPVPSVPSAFKPASWTDAAHSSRECRATDEGYADFHLKVAGTSSLQKQAASNEQVPLPPELAKDYAAADISNAPGIDSETARAVVRSVVDLQLGPGSVALVRRHGQTDNESQIYDCKGNEISYTFGGLDEFYRQYERAEGNGDNDPTHDRKTAGWKKRFTRWGRGVMRTRQASRVKATHEMEIWHLKLKSTM